MWVDFVERVLSTLRWFFPMGEYSQACIPMIGHSRIPEILKKVSAKQRNVKTLKAMNYKNLIDRELHIMVRDGLHHTLRMTRIYEKDYASVYIPIVRTCLRYYATKVKNNRRMKWAARLGGVCLADIVNEEFEKIKF